MHTSTLHRTYRLAAVLLILLGIAPVSFVATQAANDWQPVAAGIDYREFRQPGPNNVFVTRMERANPNVTLETGLGMGRLGERETVRGMAQRYDQAISYWNRDWGSRSRVVAAINGDFFASTGAPRSGQLHSGWYSKRFNDLQSNSGFGWTLDRRPFIGLLLANTAKPDFEIAELLHTSWLTVLRTRHIFVEGGLDFALNELPRAGRLPKIDDKTEEENLT